MQALFLGGGRRQLTWRGGGPEQVEQFVKIPTQRLFLGPELLPDISEPDLIYRLSAALIRDVQASSEEKGSYTAVSAMANMGLWDSFVMEAGKPCSGSCALQKQGPKKSTQNHGHCCLTSGQGVDLLPRQPPS